MVSILLQETWERIVCIPILSAGGGVGLRLLTNFQKWGLTESRFLEGVAGKVGFTKNQYIGGNFLKKRGLDNLQIQGGRGAWQKRRGGVFEWRVFTLMHTKQRNCLRQRLFSNLEAKIRLLLPGKPKGASSMQVF